MTLIVSALLLCAALPAAAEIKIVTPTGAKVSGPQSPGILAGEFLYVSSQDARNASGSFAATAAEQVTDCLKNVQAIVEAAGLSMEHVVYAQLYLTDMTKYGEVNAAWTKVFPRNRPARATIGVAGILGGTPVAISVVAVRNLASRKLVIPRGYPVTAPMSPAVLAGDRLFVSGTPGRDVTTGSIPRDPAEQVQLALDRVKETLAAAGMDFRHMVFVNPYLTSDMPMEAMNKAYARHFEFGNTPARATIRVTSLPHGANIEFSGVAIRDLSKRRAFRPKNMEPSATASPCVMADDTLYCSAKSGFIPGPRSGIYASTVEHQTRQTMRNLLDGLEEAGLTFASTVAINVYLDDISESARLDGAYSEYFGSLRPARTTVQPIAPVPERKADERGRVPKLEEISLIAVR